MTAQIVKQDYSAITATGQIPLCMIGDSITWAEFGDHWRKELLKHLPNLAFIGSHSACFGYSHAGEGGNNTNQVLARLNEIPDCLYYNQRMLENPFNICLWNDGCRITFYKLFISWSMPDNINHDHYV